MKKLILFFILTCGGTIGWIHLYLSHGMDQWWIYVLIIVCAVGTLIHGEIIVRIIRAYFNKQKK